MHVCAISGHENVSPSARCPCDSVPKSANNAHNASRRAAADVSGVNVCVVVVYSSKSGVQRLRRRPPFLRRPPGVQVQGRSFARRKNNNSTPRRASHSGEGRRVEKEARLESSELEMGRARGGVVPTLADGEMTFLIAF
ncbi:hypothetical protein MRX96_052071 [Rhipicephalus microplus]